MAENVILNSSGALTDKAEHWAFIDSDETKIHKVNMERGKQELNV